MTTTQTRINSQRNTFPKRHLVAGEQILWEGRPSIIVYFLRSLLLFIFGTLFGVLALVQKGQTLDLGNIGSYLALLAMLLLVILMVGVHRKWGMFSGIVGLVIIGALIAKLDLPDILYFVPMFIGLMAFAIEYVVWTHTYFAISDRRIMTQYGIFNIMFADTQIDRVQNVTVVQPLIERIFGYGDLMFATAGEMGGIQSDDGREMMRSGGAIVWQNIPKPFQVRKVAEEIIFQVTRRQSVQYVQQPVYAPAYVAPPPMPAPAPAPTPPYVPPVTNTAATAPPIPTQEAEERMMKLKEMREKNLISEEEFQQKRREILGRM